MASTQQANEANPRSLSRRQFVKAASKGALGVALASKIGWRSSEVFGKVSSMSRVVIHRDEQATEGASIREAVVHRMLREAIEALTDGGGWQALFPSYQAGETIAIKINAIERRMTSHREVVDAIVEGLVGIGGRENDIIVWDRTAGELSKAGYVLNEGSSGVRIMATNRLKDRYDRTQPVTLGNGTVHLSRILTDATYLINVPILKDHGGAGITFSLKNHLGSIDYPRVLHDNGLQKWIAPLYAAPEIRGKTRVIIGDALFGIYKGGPGGSPQFTYNGLIVGTDPVAVDAQARLIIDEERAKHDLRPVRASHLEDAAERGLGTDDPDRIEVITLPRPISTEKRSWGAIKAKFRVPTAPQRSQRGSNVSTTDFTD